MINKLRERKKFDVSNKNDVKCFKEFLETGHWNGGCPYTLEHPWISIPDMIKDKIVRHHLKVKE